ncbi:MAG: hypothetical protein K6F44_06395 [Lachnospiraceae bacterium]|nr:hypothetical protein [Lachnospiraceae bacterium]
MTALEIILLILGIAFVIISFFIIDKNPPKEKETGFVTDDREGLVKIGEDVRQNLNGEAGRIIADAQDKLESLSNDKIIAVGEYSDQVIEKIEADHKEVVFLYQMLCDKEDELKEMTNRMSTLKTECERVLMEEKEDAERKESFQAEMDKLREQLEKEKERTRELEKENALAHEELEKEREPVSSQAEDVPADAQSEIAEGSVLPEASEHAEISKKSGQIISSKESPQEKTSSKKPTSVKPTSTKSSSSSKKRETSGKNAWESVKATDGRDTRMLSRNDEIIALYKQNKSVMEISRLLQMGQGEVKLIIDLYCR